MENLLKEIADNLTTGLAALILAGIYWLVRRIQRGVIHTIDRLTHLDECVDSVRSLVKNEVQPKLQKMDEGQDVIRDEQHLRNVETHELKERMATMEGKMTVLLGHKGDAA